MKKLLMMITAAVFLFTACNDDDDNTTVSPNPNAPELEIKEIESGVHQILLDFVHAYVIKDDKDGIIVIDTGMPGTTDSDGNILLKGLMQMGIDPKDVDHLLITHAHPDHFGNAGVLQDISNAEIWMSAIDAPILEDEDVDYRTVYQKDGSIYKNLAPFMQADVQHKTKDGDIIPLAGGITVVATPGHCLGHQSYILQKK